METDLISRVLIAARSHDELPETVTAEIVGLALLPERLAGKGDLLQRLLDQLNDYDPYAGVGCFGNGTTLEEIRLTVARLKE